MVEIIPAVLPSSFADLKAHIEQVGAAAKHVQIDVVDGKFAHTKTWPYKDSDSFKTIVDQEHGLPRWEELDFEFDLMIDDPGTEVLDFVHAGASRIVLHAGSRTLQQGLQQLIELREEGGAFSIMAGIALAVGGQPDILDEVEAQFDFVQVMGIRHQGKQGEPFDEHALYLIERLRKRYPDLPIQVDGGVTLERVAQLVRAGATRLVVGHAIFEADDPAAEIKKFYNEANA